MQQGAGHKRWYVPDMYLPHPHTRGIASHETICIMNTGQKEALIRFTLFFEDDRELQTVEGIRVKALRSKHIRMDCLREYQAEIPVGVPYSLMVESTENVVVEYSRLNWIDGEATTFGLLAYHE